MRVNKTGLILCTFYLAAAICCVVWSQFISDAKSAYVLLQLPVVLQHGLLRALDATQVLDGMSWPVIYLVLGVPMLGFLVLLGAIVEMGYSGLCSGVSFIGKVLCRTDR